MITFTDKTILLCLVILAIIIDLWKQRIPNILILCGLGVGILLSICNISNIDFVEKIMSFVLGILILLIPFSIGAIGAGDVKLLGLIGFYTGLRMIINISVISFVIGGILAIIFIIGHRLDKYKKVSAVFISFINSCSTKSFVLKDEKNIKIPYAVPIGLGAICVITFQWVII